MTVKIGILPVGQVDAAILLGLREKLVQVLPDVKCVVNDTCLPMPEKAFDIKRRQYRSDFILSRIHAYASQRKRLRSVLGVVDADIFVSELNFVFGEAACPGKSALVSLWRLKPKFYGDASNMELFYSRVLKEAVHEIGHTLGLKHCQRSSCVMYFSNSIFDTDKKKALFCDECYFQIAMSINNLG